VTCDVFRKRVPFLYDDLYDDQLAELDAHLGLQLVPRSLCTRVIAVPDWSLLVRKHLPLLVKEHLSALLDAARERRKPVEGNDVEGVCCNCPRVTTAPSIIGYARAIRYTCEIRTAGPGDVSIAVRAGKI